MTMDPNLSATNLQSGRKNWGSELINSTWQATTKCLYRATQQTIRYSWVSKHLFDTLDEVQDYATQWLRFYNHERPHKANGGKPPLMAA